MVCIEYALVILLFLALICDLKTDKVPNVLILVGYGVGMINFVLRYGWIGILWCVLLVAAVWVCLMPVHVFGGLGGGDCKLLAWIVLFLEKEQLLECYFLIFACGAVVALAKLLLTKRRTFHFTIAAILGVVICIVVRKIGGEV